MSDQRSPAARGDLRYRAMADPTRRHLLRLLDDSPAPVTLDTLSTRVGLHVNTVRDHLRVLEQAELVRRSTLSRPTPGRPRVAFVAVPREERSPVAEGYRFLADVLAGAISAMSETPSAAARAAGRDYGLQLVEREPKTPVPAEAVIDQVMTTFSELGFAPESVSGADSTQIRLHDCPFRELAKTRGDVVCSIHEGLLAGMLE